jgi:radical SAM superfamily enzyme YgiQ (UPF0313 family)
MARVFLIDATAVVRSSPFLAQPVGLLSLAAVLRKAGHRVVVHDCKIDIDGLPRRLAHFAPDIVGIRSLSVFLRPLEFVAAVARSSAPKAFLVVGGPHATLDPEDAIRRSGACAAVLGEGEATLPELVEALVSGADLAAVAGLALPGGGRTAPRAPIHDLDSLPMPAWDLLDMDPYFRLSMGGTSPTGRAITQFTTRGCPWTCAFCHNLFGRKFRARSPEAVLDEMRYLKRRFGPDEFELHDDAFNLDRDRVLEICRRIERERLGIHLAFPNGLRGDRLDRDLLVALRDAGLHHTALSPETATPRLQEMLGKRMDLDRLLEAAAVCDELGILTQGYFMIGFPTETREEILATIDWACRSPLHAASFFAVTPFPGTRVAEWAKAAGRMPRTDAGRYTTAAVNLSEVPDSEFRKLWHSAYRRFYLDLRRVVRLVRTCPDWSLLVRNGAIVATRFLG